MIGVLADIKSVKTALSANRKLLALKRSASTNKPWIVLTAKGECYVVYALSHVDAMNKLGKVKPELKPSSVFYADGVIKDRT